MTTLTRRRPHQAQPEPTSAELFKARLLAQLDAVQTASPDEYRGIWWLFRQSEIWEDLCGRYSSVASFTLATSGKFSAQLRHLAAMDNQ